MNKSRLKLKGRWSNMLCMQTKEVGKLFFNQEIGCECTCEKKGFLCKKKSKLLPRGDGPFQILERINDNAYKVDLPGERGVSATFNVADLSPFDVGDEGSNSMMNSFEGEGMMETKEAQVEAQRAQGPKMHCKDLEAQ